MNRSCINYVGLIFGLIAACGFHVGYSSMNSWQVQVFRSVLLGSTCVTDPEQVDPYAIRYFHAFCLSTTQPHFKTIILQDFPNVRRVWLAPLVHVWVPTTASTATILMFALCAAVTGTVLFCPEHTIIRLARWRDRRRIDWDQLDRASIAAAARYGQLWAALLSPAVLLVAGAATWYITFDRSLTTASILEWFVAGPAELALGFAASLGFITWLGAILVRSKLRDVTGLQSIGGASVCASCGYPTAGSASSKCSECGKTRNDTLISARVRRTSFIITSIVMAAASGTWALSTNRRMWHSWCQEAEAWLAVRPATTCTSRVIALQTGMHSIFRWKDGTSLLATRVAPASSDGHERLHVAWAWLEQGRDGHQIENWLFSAATLAAPGREESLPCADRAPAVLSWWPETSSNRSCNLLRSADLAGIVHAPPHNPYPLFRFAEERIEHLLRARSVSDE